jgi:hypothetical protein
MSLRRQLSVRVIRAPKKLLQTSDKPFMQVTGLVRFTRPMFPEHDGTCVKRRVLLPGWLAEMPPGRAVKR